MARRCDACGKGTQTGNNVPHSKHKTKRVFRPNLQNKRIQLPDGTTKKFKLCTSCIKSL